MSRSCSMLLVVMIALTGTIRAEGIEPATGGKLPPLPDKVSSFGAAVAGDALYVYGGHVGGAHQHSKENLSYKFSRLRLDAPSEWEALPMGPGLQSPALVAHQDALYRVGGLNARNEPKQPEDLVSVVDFEKFDPKVGRWTKLAPLPEGRSSHDAVAAGDKLYVVGGWNLGTNDKGWYDEALVFDLAKPDAGWTALPKQPFKRRALAAAWHDGKVWAIGGMGEQGPSLDVHCFDPATQTWSEGPSVPKMESADAHGATMNGFGCAACGVEGKLYLSTMDGALFRISEDGKGWQAIGKLEQSRFFHRMVPYKNELLVIGGASMQVGHLDSIERIQLHGDK